MSAPPMSGFKKTLAGSVAVHAAALAAAALIFSSGADRVFITPVYTVDLVSQGPVRARQAQSAPAPEPPAPEPQRAPEQAPAKQPAAPAAPAAETVKIKAPAPAKPSVDEALKKIEEKVDRRKDEKLVASSIDSLKKKLEAERLSRVDRVARLKEEIGSRASSTGSAQAAKSSPDSGRSAGSEAPRVDLEKKYSAYYGTIKAQVNENWSHPVGVKDNISVIASIKIARDGRLLDVTVEESSGNRAFDDSLVKAVRKAAPFPPLPADLEVQLLDLGLRFCPDCAQ